MLDFCSTSGFCDEPRCSTADGSGVVSGGWLAVETAICGVAEIRAVSTSPISLSGSIQPGDGKPEIDRANLFMRRMAVGSGDKSYVYGRSSAGAAIGSRGGGIGKEMAEEAEGLV
jgi:hypothetical protein